MILSPRYLGRVKEEIIIKKSSELGKSKKETWDKEISVTVRPRSQGKKVEIKWSPDSGVNRSLLAEADWVKVKKKNPSMELLEDTNVRFRPYGTNYTLPVLGKIRVRLQCVAGGTKATSLYVVRGQRESLLGERDGVALGIIHIIQKAQWRSSITLPRYTRNLSRKDVRCLVISTSTRLTRGWSR